ncbi:hypothetical protein nbrc107697_20020 [Gordonia crocea]|uniref:Uncharacterized protein n=1 Tax=Gordonia crocea TaxID=589162 RepID=A0A7I9UYD0_9ACTN|nr:hypothetical protein nbrc107697_20020 [Gordonia crocea]
MTGSLSTHKPSRCAGFRSGRLALHVDAVISVLAGIAVIVLGLVHTVMPTAVHAVVGVALAAWGVALWLAPARWPLRAVLAVVTAVNIVALIALVVVVAVASGDLRWLALVGALVVVIIGIWEWLALRKTQGPVGETR